jgi:hypothetical protein
MATGPLEDRVAALETEMARLKAKIEDDAPWWKKIWGTFADDPMYLEAMRLGRQYRQSLRPKPRKRRKK